VYLDVVGGGLRLYPELVASGGGLYAVGGDSLRSSEVYPVPRAPRPLVVLLAFASDDVRETDLIGGDVKDGTFVVVPFKRKFKFMAVKLGTLDIFRNIITRKSIIT
jgi:hypothetical protein